MLCSAAYSSNVTVLLPFCSIFVTFSHIAKRKSEKQVHFTAE